MRKFDKIAKMYSDIQKEKDLNYKNAKIMFLREEMQDFLRKNKL